MRKLFYSDHSLDTLISNGYAHDICATYTFSGALSGTLAGGANYSPSYASLAQNDSSTIQGVFWPLAVSAYIREQYEVRTGMKSWRDYTGTALIVSQSRLNWYMSGGNNAAGIVWQIHNISSSTVDLSTIGVQFYITWIRGKAGLFSS